MFARTDHLFLRPAWNQDASALRAAIGSAAQSLCWGRWPTVGNVEHWLEAQDPMLPRLLVFARTDDAPELIGGTGLHRHADGDVELDCWISPHRRNLGFATEASHAMLGIAQALGLDKLTACVFGDDRAALRIVERLGFQPCGPSPRQSAAQDASSMIKRFRRQIGSDRLISSELLAA
ncbi:MAG: GNAT family N-acetyltransferase [Sphingomonadaceae bacterium]